MSAMVGSWGDSTKLQHRTQLLRHQHSQIGGQFLAEPKPGSRKLRLTTFFFGLTLRCDGTFMGGVGVPNVQ